MSSSFLCNYFDRKSYFIVQWLLWWWSTNIYTFRCIRTYRESPRASSCNPKICNTIFFHFFLLLSGIFLFLNITKKKHIYKGRKYKILKIYPIFSLFLAMVCSILCVFVCACIIHYKTLHNKPVPVRL